MDRRNMIKNILKGEKSDIIPCWKETPMDATVRSKISFGGTSYERAIKEAEFFDNCVISVGLGFETKTLEKDDKHHVYRYPTGSVWEEVYKPTFFKEALSFPINTPQDVPGFIMPDDISDNPNDYRELRELIKRYQDAGYYVEGGAMGIWQAQYYYLTSFENILTWMAIEPDTARELYRITSEYSLKQARMQLECGVDGIITGSDLGSARRLLFSPDMFYKFIFGWLKELADLCHSYGAFLHMHSHGHIQDIMDGIVKAGVDMINPIGPSDYNDLALFKERWGNKITIHGGISTKIAQMSDEEMAGHIKQVIDTGRRGGRFFPRTESGVPFMPFEKIKRYVELLKNERKRGYE